MINEQVKYEDARYTIVLREGIDVLIRDETSGKERKVESIEAAEKAISMALNQKKFPWGNEI